MRTAEETAHRVALVRAAYEELAETGRVDPERLADDSAWDMSNFTSWDEQVEEARFELLEVIDAPGDEVVAIVRQEGRDKESGALVETSFGSVWTLRDDKLAGQKVYAAPAEALTAVGAERRERPR
jgi:ketosteroid isomerase-like protein